MLFFFVVFFTFLFYLFLKIRCKEPTMHSVNLNIYTLSLLIKGSSFFYPFCVSGFFILVISLFGCCVCCVVYFFFLFLSFVRCCRRQSELATVMWKQKHKKKNKRIISQTHYALGSDWI